MTVSPQVELRFNPTDLRPQDLPRAGAFLGSPADALEASLAVVRAAVVDEVKEEISGIAEPTQAQLLRILDLAWQGAFWRFRKISAPIMADAYIRAYRAADAGDVPMHVVYDLADKHAEKVGMYFHESSSEAVAEGFSTLVNRRLSAKAAADRVLDAYGLTPRQMRAYAGASTFRTPISDVMPRALKAQARAFIDKSFTTRIRKLSRQEEHNIDQQAQQFAWMWLQEKGRLSEEAEKLWITARDERVCEICGPLHGKKVRVNEQFRTPYGEFWTPGLHPNCRCVVRLLEHRFKVQKDLTGSQLYDFNREHPRGHAGRFSAKARTQHAAIGGANIPRTPRTAVLDRPQPAAAYTPRMTKPEVDQQIKAQFEALIAAQPPEQKLGAFQSAFVTTPVVEFIGTEPQVETEQYQKLKQEIVFKVVPPEAKVQFVNKVETALDMRALTETKPIVKPKSPAISLETTAYTVVGREQFGQVEGKPDLTRVKLDGAKFYSSKQAAANAAADQIQAQVDEAVDSILLDGATVRMNMPAWSEAKTLPEDVKAKVELTPQQVAEIVAWHAGHQGKESDTRREMWFDWYTDDGREDYIGRSTKSYEWLGNELGVESDDFEVYLLETNAGFDQEVTDKGETWHMGGSPDAPGGEKFELTGEFVQVPDTVEQIPGEATTHRLEPGQPLQQEKVSDWSITTFKVEPKSE